MTNSTEISHSYRENACELELHVKKANREAAGGPTGRFVENIRNCDIFIEDYHVLIYLDVQLYKFRSARRFDLKDLKNITFKFNSKDNVLTVNLPCLPLTEEEHPEKNSEENKTKIVERPLDLWKLKRITDNCLLKIDDNAELLRPEGSYGYGFASKFHGRIRSFDCDLDTISRMPEPDRVSPLQRLIDRDIDEMKNFCRDQYKLNFVELQVPDGLDNPMQYTFNFKDNTLERDEEYLLHNLTSKPELMEMPDQYDPMEIDCGLISILLAICYDVRFTSNEPNCESAWTRSILSATLTYFEPFTSLKSVVISFMRRSLIYPLYRNYELSRQCVEDCVAALQNNSQWILKQLLITHDCFSLNERSVFNHYYIEDYIRYVSNREICSSSHLQMLAHNLKNVLFDVFKKNLGLGLQELETELLKELITDIHIAASSTSEDESVETESDTSSSDSSDDSDSDSDGDSVIEQKMGSLKL
ncbi:protein SHQ1 homolog [Musca vetustissima]|uniref:protein SHQ1 homolog n=1 Tax=Musca vetustissima TaxID=27455 RepID=UPI002AB6686B|nr:protein SHQ1 homolog [Musca vetustissima]